MQLPAYVLFAAMAMALGACGEDVGSLSLRISGEGAAKQGYPFVKNNETIAFVDGWQVQFTKVLVSVADIQLATAGGQQAPVGAVSFVADLRTGDPTLFRWDDLAAKRWDRFGFRIVPPTAASVPVNAVAAEDIARMTAGGFAYWIEGTAQKANLAYSFTWGLKNPTRNANCTNGLDGTDGFVVRPNTEVQAEITIHLDHLFWDTLGSEGAKLRFDAIAGASRDDATVTLEDLALQPLSDPLGPDGTVAKNEQGQALFYNPGSVPLPLGQSNLAQFILASSASQAHVNGLGLCTVSRL